MKKMSILSIFAALSTLLLSACSHNQTPPPGYCHQLKTAINRPTNIRPHTNTSPYFGDRAAMVQEYKQLDCGD